jgi:hypothetical protein
MDTKNSEHLKDCSWHKDWHTCSCGVFDNISPLGIYTPYTPLQVSHICSGVIPDTFIMCGEMGQYCSRGCLEKAKAKDG